MGQLLWPLAAHFNRDATSPIRLYNCLTTELTHIVHDEPALLAGVRGLDPEVLTEVHDRYYPAIFRYIAFRVGDQETAEDLASEVFVRLLGAVRDRSAPQNTLRGWLYGVASRVVADYYRKHYRKRRVELSAPDSGGAADPADALDNKQAINELQTALLELTDEQQNVIALRFGFEMPIREVAQSLGKSEGAVKQLQARAIATLARKLSARR